MEPVKISKLSKASADLAVAALTQVSQRLMAKGEDRAASAIQDAADALSGDVVYISVQGAVS